jgi:predicted regulator of Ras-like GTPase activity (Roadblock/LC7/MglB family)
MFAEILQGVLSQTPGAVAVTVMGFDGIPIDTQEHPGDPALQHQTAIVELGPLATQLQRISESMGTGEVKELSVQTGGLTTVVRWLTEEYFIALSLTPDGNVGKGRYLMRVAQPKLQKELS